MAGYVYILASKPRGTLYTGVTSNLEKRMFEHTYKSKGFVKRYGVITLVFFQYFDSIHEAIEWEKKIKKWKRRWKIQLIEEQNSRWTDLMRREQLKSLALSDLKHQTRNP